MTTVSVKPFRKGKFKAFAAILRWKK